MSEVIVYATQQCPYCMRARQLLESKGVNYTLIDVSRDPAKRAEMAAKAGRTSVPQIWINKEHIGGCDDLMALERAGKLDIKLNA
ncbi:MAG: glutaredoxin 3 [Gammaproteobacteria bacterium]|nr:MAG: glutaredoxin 3 [Gammaproteobacteria bacterium]